jgi:hypothetical protein
VLVCTKNVANYVNLGTGKVGALINGKARVSVHALVQYSSLDTVTPPCDRVLCVIASAATSGFNLATDGASHLRLNARSVSTDAGQDTTGATLIATNVQHSVGAVADFTAKTGKVFLDGKLDGSASSLVWANNSFTLGSPTTGDCISGNATPPTGTTTQVNGRVGELALWGDALGVGDFQLLAEGVPAPLVRPEALLMYLPLVGQDATAFDPRSAINGTLVGALPPADHPRLLIPERRRILRKNKSGGGGSGGGPEIVLGLLDESVTRERKRRRLARLGLGLGIASRRP